MSGGQIVLNPFVPQRERIVMRANIIDSERRFQVWKYTVGHRQLLLRSTKSLTSPTRIDVFFKGVVQFHLPTSLAGLSIAEVDASDINECRNLPELGIKKETNVYKVTTKSFVGYVVSLTAAFHEDEGEYDDPSFFAKENIL